MVAKGMPVANGLAWAAQLHNSKRVSIAYFGDGASDIGAFHASLNLASLWKLPVVFVCQNNGFAEHSRYELGTSVDFISKRAIVERLLRGVLIQRTAPVSPHMILNFIAEKVLELPKSY